MKRAALYCRVSTDRQALEGDSIPAQLKALRDYANKHHCTIAGEYIDDGVSGTKYDERDELQHLLNDVRAKKIDVIFFAKLDRWFRSVRHYLNTQAVLDEYGVGWVAIWEHYDTTTPQGRLMVNQMLSFAQFEAENTALRISHVFDYKKSQHEAISGMVPFGYSIVDKHLEPNDDAEAVRLAFRTYAETGNLAQTLKLTQGLGLPKTQPGLKMLLRKRKYIGEAYGIEDYHPAIIDRQTFDHVQRMLTMNVRQHRVHDYIFSGLMVCRDCGRKMSGSYNLKDKTIRYYGYRCIGAFRPLPDCTNKHRISEGVIEKYLLRDLQSRSFSEIDSEKESEIDSYQKQILSTEKKLARLKDLYINEFITLAEYKHDMDVYRADLDALREKAREKSKPSNDVLKQLLGRDLSNWYDKLTDSEKRLLWRSVIDRIEFGKDKKLRIIFL